MTVLRATVQLNEKVVSQKRYIIEKCSVTKLGACPESSYYNGSALLLPTGYKGGRKGFELLINV